ncbi:hypothetical protein Bpfe_010856 [Biomphalaria pfeifferi]|uniref:Uncharacterized protein n=1 Tax=Biomphalaria pfeifferi TaxID=112525 RepID=A0AAD8FDC5_BIOPF|nr:hypothetical protein Bpfe_010856 [Biomphalaria pfeifferi]
MPLGGTSSRQTKVLREKTIALLLVKGEERNSSEKESSLQEDEYTLAQASDVTSEDEYTQAPASDVISEDELLQRIYGPKVVVNMYVEWVIP